MAAEGRSTPAIAQALFITPKTVETDLGHTCQKLDIHSTLAPNSRTRSRTGTTW
jgi:DNA-binding CsgD family transcriptional regulator